MPRKLVVPGSTRRRSRFSLRVQVPKDLQDHYGRKEIWQSLGTEDHQEATSKALDIVRDKRAEFITERKRLRGDYRIAKELTDDENLSLGREVFSSFLRQSEDTYNDTHELTETQWKDRVASHKKQLAELEGEFARLRGRHDFAENFADQILELNLIRLSKDSPSYRRLAEISFDAVLEVQRRITSRLEGREFPEQIDPRFTSVEGEPQKFEALSTRGMATPKSVALHSLIARYVNSSHRSRTEKTRKSLMGYLETMVDVIEPGKDI